jgi:ABC-type transport system involved in multi-copper enzyme maturation permease subunit
MSPLSEVRVIFERELRKSFRSAKGIVLSVLTVAGGGGLAMLFSQLDEIRQKKMQEAQMPDEGVLLEAKKKFFSQWFMDATTGEHVASAPGLLFFLFAVSLVLMPLVVLILGFDSVAAEQQYRTVRYWTVRTRRSSYMIGKWLGLSATCALVALGMHLLIWTVCTVRGHEPFAQVVGWGVRFWLASLPILAVWSAVSVFMSSLFRAPFLSLLATAAAFFGWWVTYFPYWIGAHGDSVQEVATPRMALYFFPNFYDRFLLSPLAGPLLTGLACLLGFSVALIAMGSVLFARRDV